jgi:hypothetical protein
MQDLVSGEMVLMECNREKGFEAWHLSGARVSCVLQVNVPGVVTLCFPNDVSHWTSRTESKLVNCLPEKQLTGSDTVALQKIIRDKTVSVTIASADTTRREAHFQMLALLNRNDLPPGFKRSF